MALIKRFEDLECWKESRNLVNEIYIVCEQGKFKRDSDTRSQLKRAALSIMNNIAEGFGRYSNKEFIRFLEFSQSSALEVKSMLYVIEDQNYVKKETLNGIKRHLDNTLSLTLGLIRYLRNNPSKKGAPRAKQ